MDGPLLLLIIIIIVIIIIMIIINNAVDRPSSYCSCLGELRLVGEMMPLLLLLLSASTVTGSVSVEIVR